MKSYLTPSDQDKKPSKKAKAGVDPDTLPQIELIPEAVTAYRKPRNPPKLRLDPAKDADMLAKQEAFERGRRDALAGMRMDVNPYRPREDERTHRSDVQVAAWELGWRSVHNAARARNSDPETSHEAARRASDRLNELEAKVTAHVRSCGAYGATAEETALALGIDKQSITPRFSPLAERDVLARTTNRRKNQSGSSAVVWVAIEYAGLTNEEAA